MFSVDWEERPKLTGVPDAFIQGVMKDAPGEYVKVFLYLLMLSRQPDARISLQNLAGFFGCSESEIQAALQYWEKLHVMDLYYRSGELTGVRFTMSAAEKVRETHRLNQTRIKKLMQDNNDAARLLSALRPLLNEARQKKLDEAGRILKLLRLLPLLRESGILQNIL